MSRISSWFVERLPLREWRDAYRLWGGSPVACRSPWPFTLEGLLVFLFLVEIVTGALLGVYYRPAEGLAYESVRLIEHRVHAGWAVRQVHLWASHLLVATALLWLFRGMLRAEYRRPREVAWWMRLGIVFLVLATVVAGEILPWTQHGYWATTIRAGISESSPGIGPRLKLWMCGGDAVGDATLGRFHTAHVTIFPALLAVLLFLWAAVTARIPDVDPRKPTDVRRSPEVVWATVVVCVLAAGALAAAAILRPWPLDDPADLLQSPAGLRPDWYFLPLHGLMEALPAAVGPLDGKTFGVILTGIPAAYLAILPFLDRSPGPPRQARSWAIFIAVLLLAAAIGFGRFGALP